MCVPLTCRAGFRQIDDVDGSLTVLLRLKNPS